MEIFKNHRFLFVCFSAFLSIFGIGLIIPVIPFIVEKYVAIHNTSTIAFTVGTLVSLYAFCQFFAAPVLGALSDKFGRRPILLLCIAGSAVGYFLFGIGGSLAILYLARIIDGITGGDISTIFAYVADIAEPQDRGKYYGIIGATIGLGFMLGPTIGGFAAQFGLSTPLFLAAGICVLGIIWGYFVLPESLNRKHRMTDFSLQHLNPFLQLTSVVSKKSIRTLLIMGFYYFLPFAFITGVISVYFKDILQWHPSQIGLVFLVLGIGDMITQGYLSGKLIAKYGEITMLAFGFLLTGISFGILAIIPFFPHAFLVYIEIIIYALGSGLFEPSFGAIVAGNAQAHEQGRVMGATQSMESIARIIGPILATFFYGIFAGLPYLIGSGLSLLGIVYLLQNRRSLHSSNLTPAG